MIRLEPAGKHPRTPLRDSVDRIHFREMRVIRQVDVTGSSQDLRRRKFVSRGAGNEASMSLAAHVLCPLLPARIRIRRADGDAPR
jgi:hypothetical protein